MKDYNIHNYEDIIDLPHHVSCVHRHMSMKDRAAQFSPFAALTGHSDALDETARLTTKKIELSDDEKNILDRRIKAVINSVDKNIDFTFTYFIPDMFKEGGVYKTVKSAVHKINFPKDVICLENGTEINISEIIKIDSEIFDSFY